LIVVELKGGMGNQMFQYAFGRHLAIKNKTQLFLDKTFLLDRTLKKDFVYRNYDLNIFKIEEAFVSEKVSKKYNQLRSEFKKKLDRLLVFKKLKLIHQSDFNYQNKILDLTDNVYLNGYWQNIRYFEPIAETIRNDFTFIHRISDTCENLLEQIKMSESVCLNVRRTDFISNSNLRVLDISYYENAENKLLKTIQNPLIFVFSDDIEWCRQNIKLKSKTIFVNHTFAGEKFRNYFELMLNCKHFIIPNSSFAWWAAWLSTNKHKIVIIPKIWLYKVNFERTSNENFETKLMSPAEWITI
jgi:hypothetical protein